MAITVAAVIGELPVAARYAPVQKWVVLQRQKTRQAAESVWAVAR